MSGILHTPAPWEVWGDDEYARGVLGVEIGYGEFGKSDCRGIAYAQASGRNGGLTPIDRANARLIAAAPELLEALKAAKEMVDWFMEHSRQADHAHEELGEPLHETTGWKEMIDSGYNGLMASYSAQFDDAIAKAIDKEMAA